MKKNAMISLSLFIGLAIFLMGCPYSSEIPLSSVNAKLNEQFIGKWELSGSPDNHLTVKKSSTGEVSIAKFEPGYDGAEGTTTNYVGNVTEVKGVLFLSLREETEDTSYATYYFYRINKEGANKIMVQSVTPNIDEKFTSGSDMSAFFAANMNNSYFYETTDDTYYKIE
jgi:hypothetical protein